MRAIIFSILFLINFKAHAFQIPTNLYPINFEEISFENKIFKNFYVESNHTDYEKFYDNNALVYGETPSNIDFGKKIYGTSESNQVCYGQFPYDFCAFVFTEGENYYWSSSNNIKDIYSKAVIIKNSDVDFINECDLKSSPSNSPISTFFGIGLDWNVENINFLPSETYLNIKIESLIDICKKEILKNPEIGRNYTNLYHLKKYYYKISREEKKQLNEQELIELINILDNAINAKQPDYRSYYHLGLLNRDGFEFDKNKFQRPKDERFVQETDRWMNYFLFSFNKGNLDVLVDLVKHIQKNSEKKDGFKRYFDWYITDLNKWEESVVQSFFMNFKHELNNNSKFENLYAFEKGNEEALRLEVKSKITENSDEFMLIVFSDYIMDKLENKDYLTNSFIKTTELLMFNENFLPYSYQGWKNHNAFDYTNYFLNNPKNINQLDLMYGHEWLRWHYENGKGTGKNYIEAIKHSKLGLKIALEKNYNAIDFSTHISRLERKSLINLPATLKINFYCTDDIWLDSYYSPMGAEYGIMAVEAALSMDVFNNIYAMDSFKSNTPYLCNFYQDNTIMTSNIRFIKFYKNKSIISISLEDGSYLYTAIDN